MPTQFVVPQEMKELPQWVGVKLVPDPDHEGKMKKIPVNPKTLKPLSGEWHEKSGWAFSEVKTKVKGFALRQDDGISILDFDYGNLPDHPSYDYAQSIVKQLHSFTEISASGKGLHIIVKGKIPARIYEKNDVGLEVYSQKRFFAITGQQYNGCSPVLVDGQPLLDDLFKVYGEKKAEVIEDNQDLNGHRITIANHPELAETVQIYIDKLNPERAVDREDWLLVGMCIHSFYQGSDDGKQVWNEWSKQCPEKYQAKAINQAWKSFHTEGKKVGFSRLERLVEIDNPAFAGKPPEKKQPTKTVSQKLQAVLENDTERQQAEIYKEAHKQLAIAEGRDFSKAFPISDMWTQHDRPKFLVDQIVEENSLTMLFGNSDSKKTFLLYHLLLHLASGKPTWMERNIARPAKILLLDEEMGPIRIRSRMFDLANGLKLSPKTELPITVMSMTGMSFTDLGWILALETELSINKYDVVAFDALREFLGGKDENSSQDVSPVFNELRRLATTYHVSFIFAHHANRGEDGDFRGSSSIRASVDISLKIVSKNGENDIAISYDKGRDFQGKGFTAELAVQDDAYIATITYSGGAQSRLSQNERSIVEYLATHDDTASVADLQDALQCTPKTVRNVLAGLASKNYLAFTKQSGKKGGGTVTLIHQNANEIDTRKGGI